METEPGGKVGGHDNTEGDQPDGRTSKEVGDQDNHNDCGPSDTEGVLKSGLEEIAATPPPPGDKTKEPPLKTVRGQKMRELRTKMEQIRRRKIQRTDQDVDVEIVEKKMPKTWRGIRLLRSRRRERSRSPDSSSRDRRDRSREAEEKIPGFSSDATRSAIQSPTTLRGRNFSPGSASRDRDLSPWSKADANTRRQGGYLPKRR